jgi:hypothetical protein
MAVLQQPTNHSHPFADQIGDNLPPVGTYVATIIDVRDVFGVQRQKFQSQEIETVDLTCFLFGFRDAQGTPHKVASRQMRISGNEKSALFHFLKSLLGKAPAYGWDYCTLKGQKCLLTVEHLQRRDGSGVFAAIAALSPVPAGYGTVTGRPAPATPAIAQPAVQRPVAAPQAVPAVPVEEDEIPF